MGTLGYNFHSALEVPTPHPVYGDATERTGITSSVFRLRLSRPRNHRQSW